MATMVLRNGVIPVRGQPTTSRVMASFADSINSRIEQGAGDSHWRIPYYIFSAFFRKPRLDNESLYAPESEFFDFYQFVNPSANDIWPTAEPQTPEGANLQSNPLNRFIFGMNFEKVDANGNYIYEREDIRASKAQINLKSSPQNFRGYVFPYFTDIGLAGEKEYSAFGFANEYLSDGYINGNTLNPAGHSYGGYYGTLPTIIDGAGCGTDNDTGVTYPKSKAVIYEIDSTNTITLENICGKGIGDNVSRMDFEYIGSSKFQHLHFKNGDIVNAYAKNKYHIQQYNSNVLLSREVKNRMLRVLYNYISFAKDFDFDWFFNNQYAYAPEIGSFVSADAYYSNLDVYGEPIFSHLTNILIDQKRLLFNKSSIVSNSAFDLLCFTSQQGDFNTWNYTISSGAEIDKYYIIDDYRTQIVKSNQIESGEEYIVRKGVIIYEGVAYKEGDTFFGSADTYFDYVDDDSTVAKVIKTEATPLGSIIRAAIPYYLEKIGYLDIDFEKLPDYLYKLSSDHKIVQVPKGFTLQSFIISSSNLKKFTIVLDIYGVNEVDLSKSQLFSSQDYVFDFSNGTNFESRFVNGFLRSDAAVSFRVKDIELRNASVSFSTTNGSSQIQANNHGLQVKEILLTTTSLSKGLRYRVASGEIEFQSVLYKSGQSFVSEKDGDYTVVSEAQVYQQTGNSFIQFTSTSLPTPLQANTTYEVASVGANSFQVYSPGTSNVLTITQTGFGTFTQEASLNLNPIFLFSYKPHIQDAYALLRAATYYGTSDGDFSSSDHPFNRFITETTENSEISLRFCQRLSNDLKQYGYIRSSSVVNVDGSAIHNKDNYELNSNAVFETMRRMSLYTRILKPDNFEGIEDEKTLKFKRYARGKYTWGQLASTAATSSTELSTVYPIFTTATTVYQNQIIPNLDISFFAYVKANFPSSDYDIIYFDSEEPDENIKQAAQKDPNFFDDYYTKVDIYDFSEFINGKIVNDLNNDLKVLAAGGDPNAASKNYEFTPLEYIPSYDCLIISSTDQSKSIFLRFQDAGGTPWINSGTNTAYVKKFKTGTNTTYNVGIEESLIIPDDLSFLGGNFYILIGRRSLNFSKGLYEMPGIFKNIDANRLYSTPGFVNAGQNFSIIYNKYPYINQSDSRFYITANIYAFPNYTGFNLTKDDYVKVDIGGVAGTPDAEFALHYPNTLVGTEADGISRPIADSFTSSEYLPVTGVIEDFVSVYSSFVENLSGTLKAGYRYKVNQGVVTVGGIDYKQGDMFVPIKDVPFVSKIIPHEIVYRTPVRTKKFDLGILGGKIYSKGDVSTGGSNTSSISLIGLLNRLIYIFHKKGIYLNQEALEGKSSNLDTFSPHAINISGNSEIVYQIPTDGSISEAELLNYYNRCLAGFAVKFSSLDSSRASFNNTQSKLIERSEREEQEFWMSIIELNGTEVSDSRVYFDFNSPITLPKLASGQSLRFNIPVNTKIYYQLFPSYSGSSEIVGVGEALLSGNTYVFGDAFYAINVSITYTNLNNQLVTESFSSNAGGSNSFTVPPCIGLATYTITSGFSLTRVYPDLKIDPPTEGIETYVNRTTWFSIVNYSFASSLSNVLIPINQNGSLSIKRKINVIEESSFLTRLRDVFQGIVPDPDGLIAGNSLSLNREYIVTSGSIIHDNVTYTAPNPFPASPQVSDFPKFKAKNKFYTKVSEYATVLPVDSDNKINGIIEIPFPEGYSNEWVLWMNFLPYNASDSSPFKEEVYAATGSPFYDRCHINSESIVRSQENRHLNLGQELARFVEAPPSYRYMPLLNKFGYIFYENVIGNEAFFNERSKFYKSCPVIQTPYKIKKAYFKLGDPNNVYIELDREIDGSSVPYSPNDYLVNERSDFNGLKDWLARGNGMGNVNFRIGDSSLTNSNGINQIQSVSSNQYKGSYYPRFFFLKLIPKPYYSDSNDTFQALFDSYMDHEHVKQAELYIEAMREGFTNNLSEYPKVGCEALSGHLTPPDYTYEQLMFESTNYDSTLGNKWNGNIWPSLLTFSTKINIEDPANQFNGPLRSDNPRGFGPLPNIGTYTEPFQGLVNAVNNLKKFRIPLPFDYYASNKSYGQTISQAGLDNDWTQVSKGTYPLWVLKTNSPSDVGTLPLLSQSRINLRTNEGGLLPTSATMSYNIIAPDRPYNALNQVYIEKVKNTCTIEVENQDSVLIDNAYSPIKDYLNTDIRVPASIERSANSTYIGSDGLSADSDECYRYFTYAGKNNQTLIYNEIINPRSCVYQNLLNLTLLPMPIGNPYFNNVIFKGCTSILSNGDVKNDGGESAAFGANPYVISPFTAGSTTNAIYFEAGYQIIEPLVVTSPYNING